MKILFLLVSTILFLSTSCQGQEYILKGNSIISGNFNFSSSESENNTSISKTERISFSPSYGKFIKDNMAIGGFLTHYFNEISTFSPNLDYVREIKSYSIGIFLKNHYPINEKFGGFLMTRIRYRYNKNLNNDILNNDKQYSEDNAIAISASLGLYYFLWKRLSIETSLGYASISKSFSENDNSTKYKNFNFQLTNSISFEQFFTLNYYF